MPNKYHALRSHRGKAQTNTLVFPLHEPETNQSTGEAQAAAKDCAGSIGIQGRLHIPIMPAQHQILRVLHAFRKTAPEEYRRRAATEGKADPGTLVSAARARAQSELGEGSGCSQRLRRLHRKTGQAPQYHLNNASEAPATAQAPRLP